MSYTSILANLTSLVEQAEKQEKLFLEREKQESTLFNPFQFMRTDEDGLSYIIAFLLNPKSSHGQQEIFLKQFLLELVNTQKLDAGLLNFDKDSVNVIIHQPTYENRYHDIFIKTNNWVMSIESKLNKAKEQPNQIFHYISDLKKENQNNHFMIYLPVSNKEPSTGKYNNDDQWKKLEENNRATIITPDFLYRWLLSCENHILSSKITDFISYFKSFLDGGFNLGYQKKSKDELVLFELNDLEFRDIFDNFKDVNFLMRYRKEFNFLIKVIKNTTYYSEITSYCLKQLEEQLNLKLKSTYYKLENNIHSKNSIYPMYFNLKDKYSPFSICYENNGRAYWAVKWQKYESSKHQKLRELFSSIKSERYAQSSSNYPIWDYCAQDYLAFWNDESWVKILDGSLVQDLWKNIQGLIENKDILNCLSEF